MKARTLFIITSIIISSAILISLILFYGIQTYSEPFRESTLELRFEKEIITVFIRDQTHISTGFTELTTIPLSSLVKAYDKLPETSSTDRIITGSIVSETEKSGTYITKNGDTEFWYTIDDGNDYGIITIDLRNHKFDRMVFDSENNLELIKKINGIVSEIKTSSTDEYFDILSSVTIKTHTTKIDYSTGQFQPTWQLVDKEDDPVPVGTKILVRQLTIYKDHDTKQVINSVHQTFMLSTDDNGFVTLDRYWEEPPQNWQNSTVYAFWLEKNQPEIHFENLNELEHHGYLRVE